MALRAAMAGIGLALGAAQALVVYRLPSGLTFAQGLTFAVSIRDSLAVPALKGAYRASMQLYDELNDAL